MNLDGDVWIRPRTRIPCRGKRSEEQLEKSFQENFTGGFPVLYSSARAGIMLILRLFHRQRTVSIFPYASQCVVKAAMLAGKFVHTPLPLQKRDLVFNQWGLHQIHIENSEIFLEDSADSLYPIGGSVCKANSRFEVWSFPKILGTTFGGVVWCKSESDACALREIRNRLPRQNFLYHTVLSVFKSINKITYRVWENYLFSHPSLNKVQIDILSKELDEWSKTYERRRIDYEEAVLRVSSRNSPRFSELQSSNFGVIPIVIECESQVPHLTTKVLNRVYPNGRVERKFIYAYQKERRKK